MANLYDTDFYAWTQTQAAALAAGHVSELDLANLAEEIESLGKSEWRELEDRLEVLLMHLLKWRYQPEMRQTGHSWSSTIYTQRARIARRLRLSPSLRSKVADMVDDVYGDARYLASGETRLPLAVFPEACPWTPEQILDLAFWPEEETF
jgi:hypothetical protein